MSNETNNQIAAGLETAPRPSSKKWIVASIIAAVVLISAVVVYGFMSSKTPKEAYLYAELKSFEKAQAELDSTYGEYFELQERLENEPYSSETDISGNFEVQLSEPDPSLMMVQAVLDQINISIDQQADLKNNEQYAKLGIELQGNTLADAEVVQSGDKLGVRVPIAYTDFLYLDTTQFGEFMRRMDPYYYGPETLNLDTLKLSDIKLSDKEKEQLKSTYGKLLLNELDEENFTRENGVKVNINGTSVKTDKIELDLSEKEIQSLLESFFKEASKDKNLQDIIVKRYVLIANTDPSIYTLSSDELREMLVTGFEEAANSVDEIQLDSGIQSTIWVNSDDIIVQREIKFKVDDGYEPVQFVLSTYNVENDGKTEKQFKVNVKGADDSSGFFAITSEKEGKGKEGKGNIDITLNAKEYGEEILDIVFAIESDYKKGKGNEVNATHNFDLSFGESMMADVGGFYLNGTVEETTDINLAKDYANSNMVFTINAGDDSLGEGATITLNVSQKTEFKDSIDVPSLEGGVNITELTDQELYSLIDEITYNVQSAVYGLMGQFGGF